jgi:hypothetical protein
MMKKRDWHTLSLVFGGLSLLSVLLAGWGFVYLDFWLASTQWLLIAAVLGLWAVWTKLEQE